MNSNVNTMAGGGNVYNKMQAILHTRGLNGEKGSLKMQTILHTRGLNSEKGSLKMSSPMSKQNKWE